MDAGMIERIERSAERGAATLFAVAVGYAAYACFRATQGQPLLGLLAAGAGVLAFVPCSFAMRAAGNGGECFDLPHFALQPLDFSEASDQLELTDRLDPDELLLTETVTPVAPLVLDELLAELGPDARVVRLFDRKGMPAPPTPGQLQSRIADHLDDGAPLSTPSDTPPDASQALSAALAELRRSLR
jgi:hypothetical protein